MPISQGKTLVNYPVRPLNKGMRLDMPPNGMEQGAFLRLQNYRVDSYGIKRRSGFMTFDANTDDDDADTIYNERLFDLIHFYKRQAQADLIMLGEKTIFRRDSPNKISNLNLRSEDLVISTNDETNPTTNLTFVTVTLSSDEYDLVRATDSLVSGTNLGEIVSVSAYSGTEATFVVEFATPVTADELIGTCDITHNLFSRGNMTPTFAVLPVETASTEDRLIIADQADRGLYEYTSGSSDSVNLLEIDSSPGSSTEPSYTNITTGRVCRYFDDRLWLGNTVEVDGEHRQRIRWSEPINFSRFRFENYLDLPYSEGNLINIVPLGSLLVLYFEDAIYVGHKTNYSGLPYKFTRVETGNVGLVATKAVVPWVDMHYFVGQDDIYIFSGTTAIQPISASINPEALDYTKSTNIDRMRYIQCEHDPITDTIAFIFPDYVDEGIKIEGLAQRIWRFNYRSNSFSYDEVPFLDDAKTLPAYLFAGLMPSKVYLYGKSWENWQDLDPVGAGTESDLVQWVKDAVPDPSYIEAFTDYNTWYDLIQEVRRPKTLKIPVWSYTQQKEMILEEEDTMAVDDLDEETFPVWALLESPDFDMNAPDITKTFTRLSVKSFQNRSDRLLGVVPQLNYTLYLSGDMGFTWKRPMTLRYRNNYNEGKSDFRVTGSTFRFKLVNSEEVPAFKISEFVIRTVGRGLQIQD